MVQTVGQKSQAVIFDMDGVLIDSEPYWRQAMQEVFAGMGIILSEETCRETTGLRVDEVVALRYEIQAWKGKSQKQVTDAIVQRTVSLVKEKGEKRRGVDAAIALFLSQKKKLGIASSSPRVLIQAVVDKLGIGSFLHAIHSAEGESYGKPHPGVYLAAAKSLGVAPERCTAIEDSVNGVISVKAARMKCIVVPEADMQADPRFAIADWKLSSLEDLNHQPLPAWL